MVISFVDYPKSEGLASSKGKLDILLINLGFRRRMVTELITNMKKKVSSAKMAIQLILPALERMYLNMTLIFKVINYLLVDQV